MNCIQYILAADLVMIATSTVIEIGYGQYVHSRVGATIGLTAVSLGIGALMTLKNFKKNFVCIPGVNGDTKRVVVMQCDKNDF
jgi:hypothetical protein